MEELFSFFKSHTTGTAITDTVGRRDVIHMRLTNTTALIRFITNDLHPTNYLHIDKWSERI